MKCLNLTIFLIILFSATVCLKRKSKQDSFDEEIAKKYSFLLSKLNCAKMPVNQTCKECLQIDDGSKLYYYYQSTRLLKHLYKMMIHLNEKENKVLITFSGPSINTPEYVNHIYTTGWREINQFGFKIESEYSRIYYRTLRKVLIKKVKRILKTKGKSKYSFYFAGHSIGGSLALLAALDLTKLGIINKNSNKPTVYTLGHLRIGDNNFVKSLNDNIPNIFRIVKNNDYVSRTPNCYYSKKGRSWKCFNIKRVTRHINNPSSRINKYISEYANDQDVKNNINNYKKYVLYSQPIGKLIMYDEKMAKKQICKSNNNESDACEKNITLPRAFLPKDHLVYFGNVFGKCKK